MRILPIRRHPLLLAALAGAALGLLEAVLLLCFGGRNTGALFAVAALPARHWLGMVLGWGWPGSRTAEILTVLPVNGALWAVALTALVRLLRRSPRARRIMLASAVPGVALAIAVGFVGLPIWDGVGMTKLIFEYQVPGMMLLAFGGYDPYLYGGSTVGEQIHPGAFALILFASANTLLISLLVLASKVWRRLGWRGLERCRRSLASNPVAPD